MALLPVLPIRDMVLFPGVIAPLFVERPQSLKALEEASLHDKQILVVSQKEMQVDVPEGDDLYTVGTLCQIIQMVRIPDGTTKVLVEGNSRAKVLEYQPQADYMAAEVEEIAFTGKTSRKVEALRRAAFDQFESYVNLHPKIPVEIAASIAGVEDPALLADLIASHVHVRISERQELLEMLAPEKRLELLMRLLVRENELLEMEHSIHNRVRQEIDRGHREYYLKEQLRAIQEELGDWDGSSESGELREQILKARMPKEVEKKTLHELDRFSKMPSMSAEATVVRTYIDWLVALPWNKQSKDRLDLKEARHVLDEDHYGLDEVKERILEFLAVRKLASKQNARGQVLCFVGPPGVGKTSLGRSIARALGHKFVSMSLGGVRDEAEIRGHRKTYIGSLPGRIIQKMKQAGTKNPVMLLDEIDKLGSDYRGDPSAALLEVLDPEQNRNFTDNFLEVPFDLSNVMFITTANVAHTIPRPLLDRMEVISISGYVTEEKVHIAKRHLWQRIMREAGIETWKIPLPDKTIAKIITEYTREAGVRNLDRQLSKIARKLATKVVADYEINQELPKKLSVPPTSVKQYLGAPRLHETHLPKEETVGAAMGLAWTETGGDVLIIESVVMKGKGKVTFTGNLGEIMQESAQTALGYLRSCAEQYGLQDTDWDAIDIHVHVPEGAIPKDGPSAGVTLALSMLSSLTNRKITPSIAMTGEITLRGSVLPIGGAREKILAAKRHGIMKVLLPKDNKVDVEEMPSWVKEGMEFRYMGHVRDVFAQALQPKASS